MKLGFVLLFRHRYRHFRGETLLSRTSRSGRVPIRLGRQFSPLSIFLSVPLAFSCVVVPTKTFAASSARTRANEQQSAQQLVRDVVWNEVQAETHDKRHWHFLETQWKGAARKVYDVIQTKYGDVHRLLAVDGQPLDAKAQEAESKRIQKLCNDPQEIEQAQKARDADAKQERELLQMLPDAFIFRETARKGDIVTLSFTPNPSFHPSTHEAQVFHHMDGTMLVDGRMRRLLEIRGKLTTPVEFWGGLLGHLDAGGTFNVVQRNVGEGHWDMVYLRVNMDGKALFFKTISVHDHEAYSDYHRVPDDITPSQAAKQLKQDAESPRDFAGE